MTRLLGLAIVLLSLACVHINGECTYDGGCICYIIVGPGNRRPTTNQCPEYGATTAIEPYDFHEAVLFHGVHDGMFWTDARPAWRHIFFFREGRGKAVRAIRTGQRLRSRGRRGGCVAYTTEGADYFVRRCSSHFRSICLVPRAISNSVAFSATLTWQGGGPPDLDFKTINSECEISFFSQNCYYNGGAGHMQLHGDQTSCCGSGELLTFTGDFSPYSLKTLLYVHVYSNIGSIAVSQTKFTFTENGYPAFTATAPSTHAGETYWLVGCVDPSLGACSFKPVQTYSWSAPVDASICG